MSYFDIAKNEISEKCAVFGIYGAGQEASRLVFYGLWALQHRGQESSGIVSSNGRQLYRHAAAGLVSNVYHEDDLARLPGHIAIGHNRYSTSGGANGAHLQPILQSKYGFAFAHNGNLPIVRPMQDFLDTHGVTYDGLNDSEMMCEVIGAHLDNGADLATAVQKSYPLFQGAFSAVIMSSDTLIAFRDSCGIRPLSIGKIDDGFVVASETCALDTVGAEFIRDVQPGEMIVINKSGMHAHQITKPNQKLDIFELIYFARPDSNIMGLSVNAVRENFGRALAKEFPIDADVVIPVPDSAIPAALGYCRESGIPFEMALMKNRYIHRTFIRPTEALRERDLKMKLNPIPELIRGKKVIIIDDSIVRGTTFKKEIAMVRAAGAAEVHALVSSPPVKFPDFYGINTPRQDDLIAANMSTEEICKTMGADSLGYLSYDGMIQATGLSASKFCTSCFNGNYPIDIGELKKDLKY